MKAIILLREGLNHQFAVHSRYTCISNITLLFILTHTLKFYIVIKNIFCFFFFFFCQSLLLSLLLKFSDWRQAKSGLHNRLRSRIYGLIFIFIFQKIILFYQRLPVEARKGKKNKKVQNINGWIWWQKLYYINGKRYIL